MRARHVVSTLAFVIGTLVATATNAEAQSNDAQRALKIAYEGDSLYAKGQWDDAYNKFSLADTAAHSPVFVLYMARCRKNAGKLREARALYDRTARESLASNAPKPFRDAVSDAKTERDQVDQRIPSVLVVVTGARATTVRVDHVDVADPNQPIQLDPGAHVIEAANGAANARKEVRLEDGAGTVRVELSLLNSPAAPVASSQSPARGSLAPAVVALSVGVVGLGVGAVTGLIAAGKASDVKAHCVDGHCLTSDADALSSSRTFATVSTVGFIAGGAAIAAAAILFAVRPGGANKPQTALVLGPVRVRATLTGVAGSF
jgi:hypothetical protein